MVGRTRLSTPEARGCEELLGLHSELRDDSRSVTWGLFKPFPIRELGDCIWKSVWTSSSAPHLEQVVHRDAVTACGIITRRVELGPPPSMVPHRWRFAVFNAVSFSRELWFTCVCMKCDPRVGSCRTKVLSIGILSGMLRIHTPSPTGLISSIHNVR